MIPDVYALRDGTSVRRRLNLLRNLRFVVNAPLPLLVVPNVGQAQLAAVRTDVVHLGELDLGVELLRLPGLADDAVELVDLLEGEALGFVDHEVAIAVVSRVFCRQGLECMNSHEGDAHEAETTPHEEHLRAQVGVFFIDHEGRRVSDGPVEEPVASGGHGQALGAGLEREHLAGDHPGDGAPGAGEEEDVDAYECDGGLLRGGVDVAGVDGGISSHAD
jgi:hypothetical protein